MTALRIGIVNESPQINPAEVARITAAARTHAGHVASDWGLQRPHVDLFPTLEAVPANTVPLVILKDPDVANALGYHDETPDGRFYCRAFTGPVLDHGGDVLTGALSVSVTVTHEIPEAMGDLAVDVWVDKGDGTEWALELADAVEDGCYPIRGVDVSNYVLRPFFDQSPAAGSRFDRLGQLSHPFTLAKGGYTIARSAGAESQKFARVDGAAAGHGLIFGDDYPEWRKPGKLFPGARTARRLQLTR